MSFFVSWLTSPWMLGAGALAVASPVIIHLLNKRQFKIVNWAAMEFLLDANKKNRRRVQLENLIVLLLRCLAMLLLGLLLARPFLPSNLAEWLQNTKQFERIVVLDDSPSMLGAEQGGNAWEAAVEGLRQLTREMASSATDDRLTVLLTSRPNDPLLVAQEVGNETLESVLLELGGLVPSDLPADYTASMAYVDQYVRNASPGLNRVVYVLTDQRARDWVDGSAGEDAEAPAGRLRELSKLTAGCFLVDLGIQSEENLGVVDVRQERQLVSGAVARFEVDVRNWGTQAANDVTVEFRVGQGQPQLESISQIAPGETRTVVFQHIFQRTSSITGVAYATVAAPQDDSESDDPAWIDQQWDSRLEIALDRDNLKGDDLVEDSSYFYVGRVLDRIPVLLVDGDPSSLPVRSETYALLPLANPETGIAADVISPVEFESVALSRYRVIYLCNVDQVSVDRAAAIQQWVRQGGNLVLMPGNRVQAIRFNETFFRDGDGVSPLALTQIAGDPTRQTSVTFEVDPQPHPFFEKLVQIDRGIFSRTNVFSWWETRIPDSLDPLTTTLPLRLTDQEQSVALADHQFGAGRVVFLSVAADADWTDWPSSPTFIVVMFDMIREMVDRVTQVPVVRAGNPLQASVDIGRFRPAVQLLGPNQQQWESTAVVASQRNASRPTTGTSDDSETSQETAGSSDNPPDASESASGPADTVFYEVAFEPLPDRGFYEMQLQPTDREEKVSRWYACNLVADEGDLKLVQQDLLRQWLGDRVEIVPLGLVSQQSVNVARDEFWFQVLVALLVTLGLEQFLACWFGSKRS